MVAGQRSRVLEGFRAVGVVTMPLKAAVLKRGAENFVTTSVKKGFQVFDCKALRLLFVSTPSVESTIKAIAVHSDLTIIGAGNKILRFWRGKPDGEIGQHQGNKILRFRRGKPDGEIGQHQGRVTQLLVVGDSLFSYGDEGALGVWDIKGDGCAVSMHDLAAAGATLVYRRR
ncbi:hypothetical protein T484DRAFT_1822665 [Baffinella frigidus]|nr:hypothetical protein T484DRAFT_1822665 [Cryptophyta sp. CCMP2293]